MEIFLLGATATTPEDAPSSPPRLPHRDLVFWVSEYAAAGRGGGGGGMATGRCCCCCVDVVFELVLSETYDMLE